MYKTSGSERRNRKSKRAEGNCGQELLIDGYLILLITFSSESLLRYVIKGWYNVSLANILKISIVMLKFVSFQYLCVVF